MTSHNWKCIAAFLLLSIFGAMAMAQSTKLAVINSKGEVWARNLSGNSIGAGVKLEGPGLFGKGADDQFVVISSNSIAVITASGAVWPRSFGDNFVASSSRLSGSLFGASDTKYVLDGRSCGALYVVNQKGEVWQHFIDSADGVPKAVGIGTKLNGSSLFGGPNDKYVVYDDPNKRILVINLRGEVWAHDLSSSTPNTFCGFDAVGAGYKLNGAGLFGAPNDKYVVCIDNRLLVINTLGEVWARDLSRSALGPGVKLTGPGLFGAADEKYVVAYHIARPSPPPR